MAQAKHTLVALVADRPGVLNRITSLFRRRGFNIESVTVGHSELPNYSRLNMVVDGTTTSVEQVRKQLDKVTDVVKVTDLSQENIVARELALIKVHATATTRREIIDVANAFRASVVDIAQDTVIISITGEEDKIDVLLTLLKGFGVREVTRTGRIALVRGELGPLAVEERSVRTKRPAKAPE
jgi:acetolactate synthase I/III small subunit